MRCVLRIVLAAITSAGVLVASGVAAGAAPAAASAAPAWSQVPTPSPQAPQAALNAVSCHTPAACVAVGDYYNANGAQVTLAEAWHGGGWAVQPTPDPAGAGASQLLGLSCASSSACMAVGLARQATGGYPQHAMAEAWNGKSWTIKPTPAPAHVSFAELTGVSCASPSACEAVGYGARGTGEVPLAETWDGHQWAIRKVPLPSGSKSAMLYGVSCPAAAACTAVGEQPLSGATLAETWNGSAWAVQPAPSPSGQSVLSAVSCLPGGTTCTAVGSWWSNGEDVTLAEVRHGTVWKIQPTPTPTGAQGIVQGVLTGVSCGSGTACSAVGDHIDDAGHQVALMEAWNGTAWKIVPSPAAGKIVTMSGVSCPQASHCTAAGLDYNDYTEAPPGDADSFSLVEAWNGRSWATEPAPSPAGLIFNSLSAMSCASQSACATVGYQRAEGSSVAFSELWNGARWAIQPVPAPTAADYSVLTAVSCASATSCVAVGDYETTSPGQWTMSEIWNGSRWAIKAMPVPSDYAVLSGISCTSAAYCIAVGWDDGPSVGQTLVETWNGTAWKVVSTPNPRDSTGSALTAVSCVSPTSCSSVGSYLTYSSPYLAFAEYWNGSAWTIQSTPNASGTDTYLNAVSCPAPDTCTAVGNTGGAGTLVETLKDGTWAVVSSPNPGHGGIFAGVSCPSTKACSAIGEYLTTSNDGRNLAERWNGRRWTVQPAPVGPAGAYQVDNLTGVSCVAVTWCLASGWNETRYVPETGSLSGLTERYS